MEREIMDPTFSAPEIIFELQNKKFCDMVSICYERHPYYRRWFGETGVRLESIRGLKDLSKVPLVSKTEFMADPEAFRLEPKGPDELLWDVAYTAGTTSGQPTPFYNTAHDFFEMLEYTRRTTELLGITSNDVLANLFPLRGLPHGAFTGAIRTAMVLGARHFFTLPGKSAANPRFNHSTDDVVRQVEAQKATVLFGVHSFVRRVIMRAIELGSDLSSVRLCCLTGEALPPAFYHDLRERIMRLGGENPWIVNRYGITEIQGALIECRPGGPLHNCAPDQFYFEVIDIETGRSLSDGETGWITLTHLNRRGTVLLRFVLGDTAALQRDQCPDCGRCGERVVVNPQRKDHLIKLKGTLINPLIIEEILTHCSDIEEYQIVLKRANEGDPFSPEKMVLRLASQREDAESLRRFLEQEVKRAVDITPEIEIVSREAIFDPDRSMKAVRLIDLRNTSS